MSEDEDARRAAAAADWGVFVPLPEDDDRDIAGGELPPPQPPDSRARRPGRVAFGAAGAVIVTAIVVALVLVLGR